jgi:hypothetical protein
LATANRNIPFAGLTSDTNISVSIGLLAISPNGRCLAAVTGDAISLFEIGNEAKLLRHSATSDTQ